ncbi:hypothetical protein AB9M62_01695 [Bacillales bacterium AN1005]
MNLDLQSFATNKDTSNAKLSSSNYPNPDPPMSEPPVKYEPKTLEEVIRIRQVKGQQLKRPMEIKI